MENKPDHKRYSRHLLLSGFGSKGQQALRAAKVLVIGAGGLGCPVLQYLTAAGIGRIGIVDFDVVDVSNLHRQILYTNNDIGKSKVYAASERLKKMNPDVQIDVFECKLEQSNALSLIAPYDVVVDGSDNFTTRYLVNDACVVLNKILVYGAVLRYEGQVGVFNYPDKAGKKTNYRDLFPDATVHGNGFACSDVGVLGVLPGIIGNLQAAEVIKIVTGIGNVMCNQILFYNLLQQSFYTISLSPMHHENNFPKDENSFLNFDYERS